MQSKVCVCVLPLQSLTAACIPGAGAIEECGKKQRLPIEVNNIGQVRVKCERQDSTGEDSTAHHSTPQHNQVGSGVRGTTLGCSIHRDDCIVSIDIKNAFNTARHRPVRDGLSNMFPGILRLQKLWKIQKVDDAVPAYIDLAIGTRVSCTQNLGNSNR